MQLFLILVVSNRLLVYMHAGNDTLKGDFERMQLQSAFPICSDYGSEAIVLLIFDHKWGMVSKKIIILRYCNRKNM